MAALQNLELVFQVRTVQKENGKKYGANYLKLVPLFNYNRSKWRLIMSYLMAHFIGEQKLGEQIYFAVSQDGLIWEDLKESPILISEIGEKGVRDPFLIKDPNTEKYYLIATDLRIEAEHGWHSAQFSGSKNIIIWESSDLLTWSEPRSVKVGTDIAGCVWAPESIYDYDRQEFFVFWASMVSLPNDVKPKQRMYGAYTKDFVNFSESFIYAQANHHLIDMNIVYENGWYYRFVKDETTKLVKMDKIKNLQDKNAIDIEVAALDGHLVEGPQAYQLPNKNWCLIVDRFAQDLGYLPLICSDLDKADFKVVPDNEFDFGKLKKRHGSVLEITNYQFESLIKYHK